MRTPAILVSAAVALLALSGCGSTNVGRPGSEPTTTAFPTSSITCASAMPKNFRYSADHARLKRLIAEIGTDAAGAETFDDVDVNELGVLMEEGFVAPGEGFNESPTMWEFFRFLCDHPNVRAIGFVGSVDSDPQAIAFLETVYSDTIDAALRADAQRFCRTTPERTLSGHLECFWD